MDDLRSLTARKAHLTRFKGAGHPDTIRAGRELAAAHLAAALGAARDSGLDDLDLAAIMRTGTLPPEATAETRERHEARRAAAADRMETRLAARAS